MAPITSRLRTAGVAGEPLVPDAVGAGPVVHADVAAAAIMPATSGNDRRENRNGSDGAGDMRSPW